MTPKWAATPKRANGRNSRAESSPGSQRIEQFVVVDGDGKTRDITEEGWRDGYSEIPALDAEVPGEMEHHIMEHWLRPYRALTEPANHLVTDYVAVFAQNEQIPGKREVQQVIAKAMQKSPRILGGARDKLRYLREVEQEAFVGREEFRSKHGIERAASFPESKYNHFAIIIAIIVIESFANMYFFAQGNSLGYLGGLLQSMLLSLINVGVAVAMGYFVVRALHHKDKSLKYGGAIVLLTYLVFLFAFNLVVSHYRDLLAERPEDALRDAIPATLAAPFGITFDSLMLVVAGILAAGLGGYKGYKSDDRYPGYGNTERSYQKARTEYDSAKEVLRGELHAILDGLDTALADLRSKAEAQLKILEETITKGEKLEESYENDRKEYDRNCRLWLIEYRAANMEARGGTIEPTCFKEPAKMPIALDVEKLRCFPARLEAARVASGRLALELEKEEQNGVTRRETAEEEIDQFLRELLEARETAVGAVTSAAAIEDDDDA